MASANDNVGSGTRLVLSGGGGNKRKFNSRSAEVTKYPKTGPWMSVRVVGSSAPVKWRKSGFSEVLARPFPLLKLDHNLLARVFSFLGGESNDESSLVWIKDAARLHQNIALVCTQLKNFCVENLKNVVGLLDANCDGLEEKEVVPCILWLSKYKLKLGEFKIHADFAEVPMLCMLLRECDTTWLRKVSAPVGRQLKRGNAPVGWDLCSRFITKAWMEKFNTIVTIDLTGNNVATTVPLARMASDLEVPFEDKPTHKMLHDTIASECLNITHVYVNSWYNIEAPRELVWETGRTSFISQALFSSATLQHLKISFDIGFINRAPRMVAANYTDTQRPDRSFVDAFIQNLPNLVSLDLGINAEFTKFRIASEKLKSIDVRRSGKHVWFSCNCPSLERFVCNGRPSGNGTRPNWTEEEELAYHGGDTMVAETTPMIGMNVPDSCEFVLEGFTFAAEHLVGDERLSAIRLVRSSIATAGRLYPN